ncbi:MAG TPA: ATP-binding protein [Thermoanaerobaculia bacterium]|nr:ATP-binding protein [Thermoanaerobaculia bacterium]
MASGPPLSSHNNSPLLCTSAGVAGLSLVVLAGWSFDLPRLRSFVPGLVEMKVLTALTFLAAAAAVVLRSLGRRDAARLLAGLVAAAAVISILEYASGHSLWPAVLVPDVPDPAETSHPGRMAINTTLAFLALSVATMASGRTPVGRLVVFGSLAGAALITLQVVLGYLFHVRELRGSVTTTPMALPTAIAFVLLTAAVASLHRDLFPLSVFSGSTTSAGVGRKLLPLAFVVPLVAGTLRFYGEKAGYFDDETGVALMTLFLVIALVGGVLWGTVQTHLAEEAATRKQQRLRMAVEAIEQIGESLDPEAVTRLAAASLTTLFGADGSAVALKKRGAFRVAEASGCLSEAAGRIIPTTETLLGQVITSPETVRTGPLSGDDPLGCSAGSSVLAAALRHHGVDLGGLAVVRHDGNFSEDDADLLRLLSTPIAATVSHATKFVEREMFVSEQAAEIAALNEQFSAFMRNIPATATIKDPSGHYVYVNERFARLVGRDPESVVGTTAEDLFDAGTFRRLREMEECVMRDRSMHSETVRIGDVWILLLRFPIVVPDGRVFLGSIGIDITDLKHAEHTIAELNATLERRVEERTAALERANEELEAFSYSVSHDLRAPLRAIDGYGRMIEEDYGDRLGEEGRRFLGVIRSQARRMAMLIDDLLAFSRIGRQSLTFTRIDMSALVNEAAREVLPDDIVSRGREIELDVAELPPAVGDRAALRQVFVNLLSNSVKYAKPGGTVRISVGCRTESGRNVYWVRDDGIGFDMRYAEKLFQVFQRLHHEESIEGTGVGLAIVERVVTRHGGRVWAESEPGKGATFYVSLPSGGEAEVQEAS